MCSSPVWVSSSSANVRHAAIPHRGILWNRYKEIRFMPEISHLWLLLICALPPTTSFIVFSHDFVFDYCSFHWEFSHCSSMWLESVASSPLQVKSLVSGCRDLLDYWPPLADCMPACLPVGPWVPLLSAGSQLKLWQRWFVSLAPQLAF